MNFFSISNDELDRIDLEFESQKIISKEYQNYFKSKSGNEHYRLLSYIGLNNNNINILDIGTLKGCSALAFSINPTNKIYSFNIVDELQLNILPTNINFIIDNILRPKYIDLILQSSYIMLDTNHDGLFEQEFYDYLISIKYKGYLLLDDIYLNEPMNNFWKNITKTKYDITNIGHVTGTGVVIY